MRSLTRAIDKVRDSQRAGLIDFIKKSSVKNAGELGMSVHNALSELAGKAHKTIQLGVPGTLWKAKVEG